MEARRRLANPNWRREGGAGKIFRGSESYTLMQRTSSKPNREEVCGCEWEKDVGGSSMAQRLKKVGQAQDLNLLWL